MPPESCNKPSGGIFCVQAFDDGEGRKYLFLPENFIFPPFRGILIRRTQYRPAAALAAAADCVRKKRTYRREKGDKSHGRICLSDFTGKYHLCHQEQDPYRGITAGRKAGRAETGRGVRLQPGTHPGGAAAAGTGGHGRVFAQCGLLGAPGKAGGRLRDLSAAGKSGNDGAALF